MESPLLPLPSYPAAGRVARFTRRPLLCAAAAIAAVTAGGLLLHTANSPFRWRAATSRSAWRGGGHAGRGHPPRVSSPSLVGEEGGAAAPVGPQSELVAGASAAVAAATPPGVASAVGAAPGTGGGGTTFSADSSRPSLSLSPSRGAIPAADAAAVRAANAPFFAALDSVAFPGVDGTPMVVMTAGNWPYRALLGNFACNMQRVGRSRGYLTVTFDAPTRAYVEDVLGQVAYALPGSSAGGGGGGGQGKEEGSGNKTAATVATGLADYNSADFRSVTRRKLTAVRLALSGGMDVLFSDPDVVWCADAAAGVTAYVGSPAAAGTDGPSTPPRSAWGFAIQSDQPGNFLCSGFYLARSRPAVEALFDRLAAADGADDQAAFNTVLCEPAAGGRRSSPTTCTAAGGVVAGVLPTDTYASGAVHHADAPTGRSMRLWYFGRPEISAQCAVARGPVPRGKEVAVPRVTLHNNHIWPGAIKVPRFLVQGLWFFDAPAAAVAAAAAGIGPGGAMAAGKAVGGEEGEVAHGAAAAAALDDPTGGMAGVPDAAVPSLFPVAPPGAAEGYCASVAAAASPASITACGDYCTGGNGFANQM